MIALVIVLTINMISVKLFGEMEFWAALIKVVAWVTFLVIGIVFLAGRFTIEGQAPTPSSPTTGASSSTPQWNWWVFHGPHPALDGDERQRTCVHRELESGGAGGDRPGARRRLVRRTGQVLEMATERIGFTGNYPAIAETPLMDEFLEKDAKK